MQHDVHAGCSQFWSGRFPHRRSQTAPCGSPRREAGTLTVSYVTQSADNMWVGENGPMPIPFNGLDQTSLLFDATYGLSDAVALDASVGSSEVSPTHGKRFRSLPTAAPI